MNTELIVKHRSLEMITLNEGPVYIMTTQYSINIIEEKHLYIYKVQFR